MRAMQNSHSDQHCTVLVYRRESDHTEVAIREGWVDTSPEEAGSGSAASRAGLARCRANKAVDRRDWSVGRWMDL